jgi:hypothetical protein
MFYYKQFRFIYYFLVFFIFFEDYHYLFLFWNTVNFSLDLEDVIWENVYKNISRI